MYTGYSGVGALEAARNDTVRDASRRNVAAGESCRLGLKALVLRVAAEV
jgi:hypothetical protein